MPPRKQKKLEKEISEIMIVNNRKLAPYIEAVNFASRNIDQRKLGNILGIFEIKDTSEDSAYIVNFLASVSKKTYFANHHKDALESFEATLYRLNLSLSEIAKHGNINWIGKIDAVLCAIDEKNIHFSVSGDARVLLLRDERLSDISNGLSPKDEAVNPIKTFTDIASGKLEDGDKLIITTDDISHVFTPEELEAHALSFNKKDFLRFLKTALINELAIAGTIVIDVTEKNVEVKKTLAPAFLKEGAEDEEALIAQNINAFSNKTFEEAASKKPTVSATDTLSETLPEESEYTHKKTGHIYIKDLEENYEPAPENKLEKVVIQVREALASLYFWLKDRYLQKSSYQIKKRLSPNVSKIKESTYYFFKNTIALNISSFIKAIGLFFFNSFIRIGNFLKNIIPEKSQEIDVAIETEFTEREENKFRKTASAMLKMLPGKNMVSGISFPKSIMPKKSEFSVSRPNQQFRSSLSFLKKFIPNFSKIKTFFSQMNNRSKLYSLGAIAFIVIAPIFILNFQNKKEEIINKMQEEQQNQNNLSVNPSSNHYVQAEKIYFGEDIIGTVKSNGSIFIISKNKITESKQDGTIKEHPYPAYASGAYAFSFMRDLNLIFLINKDKKITSFSSISRRFSENIIDIPADAKIEAIGAYLTYIYLADSTANQIYRYPRAEGGFGEKTNWLKENIEINGISDMSIDENIYLVKDNNVIKLSKGKKESFNLIKDENSNIEKIFTNADLQYLYALDNQNGEILKFNKDGSLASFNSNQEILNSTSISSDEENNLSYFSTKSDLFKIKNPK